MATVGQDIFKPTKFGGKYTVTLIPGTLRPLPPHTPQARTRYSTHCR